MPDFEKLKDKLIKAQSSEEVEIVKSEIYGKNPNFPWKEDGDRVLGDPSVDRWSYSTSKALVEHMLFPLYRANKLDFSIF